MKLGPVVVVAASLLVGCETAAHPAGRCRPDCPDRVDTWEDDICGIQDCDANDVCVLLGRTTVDGVEQGYPGVCRRACREDAECATDAAPGSCVEPRSSTLSDPTIGFCG